MVIYLLCDGSDYGYNRGSDSSYGSGLSMTGWKPITGWLPPIGYEAWMQEFSKYRQSPEYLKINFGMSLMVLRCFWLEYIHRVAGRITGLVFFIPLIFFFIIKED